MSPRGWLNLGLLAVLAAVATVVLIEPGKTPSPIPVVLSTLDTQSISGIRIQRSGQPAITLRKTTAGWRTTEPFDLPASRDRVASVLGLASARASKSFAADTLDKYGLATPAGEIVLNDTRFAFGDTEPLHNRRYVLVGKRIHLITDRFFHHLLSPASGFVDPRLAGAEIRAIRTRDFQLETDAEGRWTGLPDGASADNANALAARWRNTMATRVADYAPELAWNRSVIVTGSAPGGEIRYDIAAHEGELVFGRPEIGIQYHLPKPAGDGLLTLESMPAAGGGLKNVPAATN